jgi:hypothetical protein
VEKIPLYQIRVDCIYCGTNFATSKIRPSFKKSWKTDTDFCVHYKEHNPDFYVVRVCPYCGFSFTENSVKTLTTPQRELFKNRVADFWLSRDFGKERRWEDALQSYKLALLCAQITGEKIRVIAGLLHHIAWLYRYREEHSQERRFLEYALDAYVKVFESESGSLDNARLMYLIGELNRRLGYFNEAIKWFSRVVNDKRIMDTAMIKACRDQWAQTREDLQAANGEMPEETGNLQG